ncbi:hypothetical protein ASC96_25785 [Rhizobium sp. Root1204]|nr:hypothetical protein ASC96_25785 [Rhizobium sp. Root1204]
MCRRRYKRYSGSDPGDCFTATDLVISVLRSMSLDIRIHRSQAWRHASSVSVIRDINGLSINWFVVANWREYGAAARNHQTILGRRDGRGPSTHLRPGSSLGGARPKASVIDQHGHLSIAKFPKETDEYNIETWEEIALRLAEKAGIGRFRD